MMYVHYEQAVEAMTKGMSQVFIAIHPAAVVDMKAVQAQMEETIEFLHSLPPMAGSRGVHAPGEGLDRTRAKNRENGIPVIFADNLKDNQRLFREFEGKETKLKTEEIDGVVFATDKKAAENGIYAYYVKQDGKIVSNVEFYYKKVRIKEKENRKWFENWFW